jgi:hypothetical protein
MTCGSSSAKSGEGMPDFIAGECWEDRCLGKHGESVEPLAFIPQNHWSPSIRLSHPSQHGVEQREAGSISLRPLRCDKRRTLPDALLRGGYWSS